MPFYAAEVYLFIYPLLGSGAGTRDNPPLCPLNAVIIDIIRFENISQLQTPFVGGLAHLHRNSTHIEARAQEELEKLWMARCNDILLC